MFETTPAHEAIFTFIRTGTGNGMIEAVAGAGKTSTLVEACKIIPTTKKVIALVFNAKNATEMANRFPRHVNCRTLNSLGFGAWRNYATRRQLPQPTINKDKVRELVDELLPDEAVRQCGGTVGKLVRLAKAEGLIPDGVDGTVKGLRADTDEEWSAIMDHYDVEAEEPNTFSDVVGYARTVLKASLEKFDVLDFDDQLYMTFAYGATVYGYDYVLVDETQDLSALQHELVAKAMGKNGRLLAVGDPYQGIYGFRGAANNSMQIMAERFRCVQLPLHVSYRCPQDVVKLAQRFVPHIQAHSAAPNGTVNPEAFQLSKAGVAIGDMVVSRITAPLVTTCYSLLQRNVPAVLLGREIGQQLCALVRKLKARSISDLREKLERWGTKESDKHRKKKSEDKAQAANDMVETLTVFMSMSASIDKLIENIERLFSDQSSENVVTLCTVHKAKGLEAKRVWIINFDQMPASWATQEWQRQQEVNLTYVAITRAKETLSFIKIPRNRKQHLE